MELNHQPSIKKAFKMSIKQHELNIVKNVIEKGEAIGSKRLVNWAKKATADLHQEIAAEDAGQPIPASSFGLHVKPPFIPAGSLGDFQPAPGNVVYEPGQKTIDKEIAGEGLTDEDLDDGEFGDEEPMTEEEIRATGNYSEEQIKMFMVEQNKPYVGPTNPPSETDTAAAGSADGSE